MRTARRFRRVWILLIATTLATPACYTLMKHPNVDLTAYEETPGNQCASCHSEDELFRIVYPRIRPLPPPRDPYEPYIPPWWWEHYWEVPPPGPSALRGFRPEGKELYGPIFGPGPVNPPPGPKAIGGDVRVKDPDDKKGEKHEEEIRDDRGTGGGSKGANDNKDDSRPVRPKSNKGKEDG